MDEIEIRRRQMIIAHLSAMEMCAQEMPAKFLYSSMEVNTLISILPPDALDRVFKEYVEGMYMKDDNLPRISDSVLNAVLDSIPPEIRTAIEKKINKKITRPNDEIKAEQPKLDDLL